MVREAGWILVILRSLGILLAACWFSAAMAIDTVVYQPQTRDAAVTPGQWERVFRSLRSGGTRTLLVQWTRYGGESFGGRGGWLEMVLRQASAEGLDLILGLHWDPAFFSWISERPPDLAPRLRAYVQQNLALAETWRGRLPSASLRGWYLPAEVDDLNWQPEEKRALLAEALESLRKEMTGKEPGRLHLSAFFGGHAPPAEYAAWLREVAGQGWTVWIQDGSGTGALNPARRGTYLDALFPCAEGSGLALIVEAFRQTSAPDEPFRARPATSEELDGVLRAYQHLCPAGKAVFSLRYLPAARGILAHD